VSKKNIIIAILGGCIVGGLGTAAIIFPEWGALLVASAGIVTTAVGIITGFQIKGA